MKNQTSVISYQKIKLLTTYYKKYILQTYQKSVQTLISPMSVTSCQKIPKRQKKTQKRYIQIEN